MPNLASVSTGKILKLNENGVAVAFYVAKHDYESSLNGSGRTLLVRKDVYGNQTWSSASSNKYSSSSIDTWLNGTYIGLLDDKVQAAIDTTAFYVSQGGNSTTVTTLQRGVFLLSLKELNLTVSYTNAEGSALPIASTLKIAYQSGTAKTQWTRTPRNNNSSYVYYVSATGTATQSSSNRSQGCRPCFTLPDTMNVSENNDGTYSLASAASPSVLTVPDTPTKTIAVRVKAVDANNAESGYATGQTYNIIYNGPPTISGEDGDLGEFSQNPFDYRYTVVDHDIGDIVTVTEKIVDAEGKTKTLRTYQATNGKEETVEWTVKTWLSVPVGSNKLVITAEDDSGGYAVRTLTFTRSVGEVHFYRVVETDAMVYKAFISMFPTPSELPADCVIEAQVTNNPFDASPAWEDISTTLNSKVHTFANNTATNGYGIGYRIRLDKGEAMVWADTIVLRFA